MLEEAWPEPCLTPWPLTSKPSVIILMPGPCGSHLQYFCFSTWSTGLPTDTSTSSSLTTPSTPHHAGLMGAPRSSRLACFQAKLCINIGKNAKNKKWSPRCRTGWSGFWGEKKKMEALPQQDEKRRKRKWKLCRQPAQYCQGLVSY